MANKKYDILAKKVLAISIENLQYGVNQTAWALDVSLHVIVPWRL